VGTHAKCSPGRESSLHRRPEQRFPGEPLGRAMILAGRHWWIRGIEHTRQDRQQQRPPAASARTFPCDGGRASRKTGLVLPLSSVDQREMLDGLLGPVGLGPADQIDHGVTCGLDVIGLVPPAERRASDRFAPW